MIDLRLNCPPHMLLRQQQPWDNNKVTLPSNLRVINLPTKLAQSQLYWFGLPIGRSTCYSVTIEEHLSLGSNLKRVPHRVFRVLLVNLKASKAENWADGWDAFATGYLEDHQDPLGTIEAEGCQIGRESAGITRICAFCGANAGPHIAAWSKIAICLGNLVRYHPWMHSMLNDDSLALCLPLVFFLSFFLSCLSFLLYFCLSFCLS